MNTLRLNITVPKDVGQQLKGMKNMSAFITSALRDKLRSQETEKALKTLQEAYRQSATEEQKLTQDWESTVGDGL